MQHDCPSWLAAGEHRTATRRSLVGQAAKLMGAGALAVASSLPVVTGGANPARATEIPRDDIAILEQLVAWELRLGALFGTALARFVSDEGEAGDRPLPTQPTLTHIWFHDRGHLALLKERIEGSGGIVQLQVDADESPQIETFAAFLWTAAEMKNASVPLYVEAVAALQTSALRKVVAGILAVEARHAAYLSGRVDEPEFTTATEGILSPSDLLIESPRFASSNGALMP